jgi:hypothetical protein
MDRLRECVALLLDESRPIKKQLEMIVPKGKPPFIGGLGRALITPILMCVHPVKYSVYNRISDEELDMLIRSSSQTRFRNDMRR